MADQEYSTNLRKERQRSSDQLKEERDGQKDVCDYLPERWIHNLASHLANQKKEHEKETTKLQKKLDKKEHMIQNVSQTNGER